eukprot:Nk52_evm103s208 gene=Nk52_evmTU103s208
MSGKSKTKSKNNKVPEDDKPDPEIPQVLNDLVKYVVRAFYPPEYHVITDILIKQNCLKEADVIHISKMDKKQVRTNLGTLRNDKLLKSEMRAEQKNLEEKRSYSYVYWYIDYKLFVNVTKYKLHFMQRKMEQLLKAEEDNQMFVCPRCGAQYSLVDVGTLLDPVDSSFRCRLCRTELQEYNNMVKVEDIQQRQGRLNEQISVILRLLKESESISLLDSYSNPKSRTALLHDGNRDSNSAAALAMRNRSKNYPGMEFGDDTGIRIDFDENAGGDVEDVKEQPEWMKQSTIVPGLNGIGEEQVGLEDAKGAGDGENGVDGQECAGGSGADVDDEVYQKLLESYYEKQLKKEEEDKQQSEVGDIGNGEGVSGGGDDEEDGALPSAKRAKLAGDGDVAGEATAGDGGVVEEDFEEDDDFEDVDGGAGANGNDEEEPKVKVGDLMVSLSEVTDEHQQQMTEDEYQAYYEKLTEVYGDQYQ